MSCIKVGNWQQGNIFIVLFERLCADCQMTRMTFLGASFFLPRRASTATISKGNIMHANVGKIDRTIRILIGLGLIGATLYGAIGI